MALTVRRQRKESQEEGDPEKPGLVGVGGTPMGQRGVGAEGQTAEGTGKERVGKLKCVVGFRAVASGN